MPSYPTFQQLAIQRRRFVLDAAKDRPYHFLAHALVDRGRDALDAVSSGRLPITPGDRRRLSRFPSEEPFELLDRTHIDRWVEALRYVMERSR